MRLAIVVVALLLVGCNGGGGDPGPMVPSVVNAMRADLWMAYFGVSSPQQLRETAAHVNCAMLAGWGNWTTGRQAIADRMLAEAREAVDLGITKLIVFVDWAIFTPSYEYRGVADLRPFVDRMKAAGLWGYVAAIYPADEPDLQGVSDAEMNAANTALREFGKPIATIYTDRRQWPGLSTCDIAGFDKYGTDVNGGGVLANLKSRLRPEQRIMLVVGGCDPWKDDVKPVLDYANGDSQVVGIVAFIYGSQWGGTQNLGIRDNGMLPQYADVGTRIKTAVAA